MFFTKLFRSKLVDKHVLLTERMHQQEELVESLREKKEEAKYNSDIKWAELYLETRSGVIKLTEAQLDAMLVAHEDIKTVKFDIIEADNAYKKAIVELNHIQRQLTSLELQLN